MRDPYPGVVVLIEEKGRVLLAPRMHTLVIVLLAHPRSGNQAARPGDPRFAADRGR